MIPAYSDQIVQELVGKGLLSADLPAYDELQHGGFVGWTHVTVCVQKHQALPVPAYRLRCNKSQWFMDTSKLATYID